jgi:hypothetical protein
MVCFPSASSVVKPFLCKGRRGTIYEYTKSLASSLEYCSSRFIRRSGIGAAKTDYFINARRRLLE